MPAMSWLPAISHGVRFSLSLSLFYSCEMSVVVESPTFFMMKYPETKTNLVGLISSDLQRVRGKIHSTLQVLLGCVCVMSVASSISQWFVWKGIATPKQTGVFEMGCLIQNWRIRDGLLNTEENRLWCQGRYRQPRPKETSVFEMARHRCTSPSHKRCVLLCEPDVSLPCRWMWKKAALLQCATALSSGVDTHLWRGRSKWAGPSQIE